MNMTVCGGDKSDHGSGGVFLPKAAKKSASCSLGFDGLSLYRQNIGVRSALAIEFVRGCLFLGDRID